MKSPVLLLKAARDRSFLMLSLMKMKQEVKMILLMPLIGKAKLL
jgi:hypothetical protein